MQREKGEEIRKATWKETGGKRKEKCGHPSNSYFII